MKKAIIYYRKSTDRDDKQANSLEHQLGNCRRTAKVYDLDVIDEIGESKSAKLEGTRDGFNKLLKLCKTGKIDYIIIDEPKRLSRNNLDSARVIDLFDKKLIKGIYSTGRFYSAEQINDIFLLQLDLSLSKMDNAHRSKEIREKMTTCINNTKRFLGKAPFGYKNVTLKKGHKDIIIEEKEAKIVREIFNLRLENKSYSTIAKILKDKYYKKIDFDFHASRVHKLAINKFYYGVFTWDGKEIIGSHKPIIKKEIFDKARLVGKGVYSIENDLIKDEIKQRKYYFKGLAKDSSGFKLSAYEKKGFTYYSTQNRSSQKLNINENLIFEQFGNFIKELNVSKKMINSTSKNIILNLINNEENENYIEIADIEKQIKSLKVKQEKLLDMKLDELINEKQYILKYNFLENEIKDCLEQKLILENDNISTKTQILFELLQSLYLNYSTTSKEGKSYIIKKLMFELSIDKEKRLQIAENQLFETLKILKIAFGTTNGFDVGTFKQKLSMIDLEDLEEFNNFLKKQCL